MRSRLLSLLFVQRLWSHNYTHISTRTHSHTHTLAPPILYTCTLHAHTLTPHTHARTRTYPVFVQAYLAPEMVLRIPYAYSVDFWQFGCFVFELYAGRSPFWLPRKPRKVIRDNILNGAFAYPSSVPELVKPLVNALLNVNENHRWVCGRSHFVLRA
jgi:serine/threonine protein kinase